MEFAESAEVFFKENLPRKTNRKLSFALVFAIVFCLLLLIVCIVLAVLYSRELNNDGKYGSQNVEKYEICDDEQCFQLGQGKVERSNYSSFRCIAVSIIPTPLATLECQKRKHASEVEKLRMFFEG